MVTPQIYDLTASANVDCYSPGRQGFQPVMLCCHSTCGPEDDNEDVKQAQALSLQAARYLLNNTRQVSAHYLVGAETIGAPIYKIIKESDTAYHCGGNPPQYPSTWQDPATLMVYHGYDLNLRSIGIEVFGQANDTLGPNQLASLKWLVQDIVSRYPVLKDVSRIVSHASLEGDRTDGRNWVGLARRWVQTMSYNPNPNNLSIGQGVLDAMTRMADVAVSREQYYVPDGIEAGPGLEKRSMTWGRKYFYLAIQRYGQDGKPSGTWDVQVYRQ